MGRKVITFQPATKKTAEDYSNAQTEHRNKQVAWCEALLAKLGLLGQIDQATTIDELKKIVLDPLSEKDPNSLEVDFAVKNAFHPSDGTDRDDCFKHITERMLKRLLRKCFNEKNADRKRVINEATQSAAPADMPFLAYLAGMIYEFLTEYFPLEEWERLILTGWVLQTHFIGRFRFTPRLLLTSPEPGCGKTTLLDVLAYFVARPHSVDNTTMASVCDAVDAERCTILADQGEDQNFQKDLAIVYNSGYIRGKTRELKRGGERIKQKLHCALALAANIELVNTMLPWSLSRSLKITMRKYNRREREELGLKWLDFADPIVLDTLETIRAFAGQLANSAPELSSDPDLPVGFYERGDRTADNFRPTVSILDACGGDWGSRIRAAALTYIDRTPNDISIGRLALEHALEIAKDESVLVLTTKGMAMRSIPRRDDSGRPVDDLALLPKMLTLDIADGRWREYRGLNGRSTSPRPLSEHAMGALFGSRGVHPQQLWTPGPRKDAEYFRGYLVADFERALVGKK
jgi:hypothetical protein